MSKIHFIMISTILSSFIYYFVGLFVQYILGLHSFKYFVALGSLYIYEILETIISLYLLFFYASLIP